jgi:hypothetical protein
VRTYLRTVLRIVVLPLVLIIAILLWSSPAGAQGRAVVRPLARPVVHQTAVTVGVRVGYPVYYPWYSPWWYGAWYSPWYAPHGYGSWYGWYQYPYPYGPYPAGPYPMYVVDDRTVSLRLAVKPREAEVYVDGYRVGRVDDFDGTFQRLHIRPGQHELVFYLAGYRTESQHIDFERFSSQKITYTMVRLEPGETTGLRPEPANPSEPAPNELRRPRPRLEEPAPAGENFGSISIRVQPADADVFVDGERWTTTDIQERLVIQLSDGKHRIEIKKTGYETYTSEIQIRRGETRTVNVSLLQK